MKRRQTTAIVIILAVLIIAVAVLAALNRSEDQLVTGQLEIMLRGESVAVLLPADVGALPAIELRKEIVSGSGDSQSGLFTGVALRTLLDTAAPGWAEGASRVICRAEDNFISAFAVDEVTADDNIMVAYLLDGKPLSGREQGGKGPFRLVIRDDTYGNRSTYWLCRIEVEY